MLLEEKQKMKKEKVLLDTWQAFMNRVWQPQIRRIWGWLHRFASFAIPKPSAGSGGALRLRLPPRIEPCRKFTCGIIKKVNLQS
jgi:hypothetical protein